MNIIGIIPARMGSSRFPGKPLAKICGIPMVEHAYHRSSLAGKLSQVYVATCDREISHAAHSFGGHVIMTKNTHERASDRVAEAMLKAEKKIKKKVDIVVMIQGDEPMVFPQMIDCAIVPLLKDPEITVVNLFTALKDRQEQHDPNEIKVVLDHQNFALYFSRAPIPSDIKSSASIPMFKQICIIPFRRDFLLQFNQWKQTPLEMAESVDMLRILQNGHRIKMVPSKFETYSVDTPADLKKVENLMKKDVLFKRYRR